MSPIEQLKQLLERSPEKVPPLAQAMIRALLDQQEEIRALRGQLEGSETTISGPAV